MEHTQRSWRAWRLPVTPVNCILGKGDAMTSKRNVEPPKAKGSPVVEELLREKKGIDEAVVEGWRSACVAVRTGQVQTNKVKRGTRNMSWKAVVCFECFFFVLLSLFFIEWCSAAHCGAF